MSHGSIPENRMGMAPEEFEHRCVIANNIMERAKDEIDLLFAATRVAHTNDEAETETMHAHEKRIEKARMERFHDWNIRREAELHMGASNHTHWDLLETMRKSREGDVFRSNYKKLRLEFDHAMYQRVNHPYRLNDTSMRENRRIKEYEERLYEEIRAHKVEKNAAMWTETYFNTEVQLLGDWISVMTRQYVNMAELGIDTMHALKVCEAFHHKIAGIISNMHVH
jgi:hypothetical protein